MSIDWMEVLIIVFWGILFPGAIIGLALMGYEEEKNK